VGRVYLQEVISLNLLYSYLTDLKLSKSVKQNRASNQEELNQARETAA